MGKKKDGRRRANKCDRGDRPTTGIADIPDELLELVLLRVRTPAGLFRAAATCKQWRRVIAGDGFLHRFRSRHGHGSHLLLGHYSVATADKPWERKINAWFVPSPQRPASRLRRRVSLDFLSQPGNDPYNRLELSDSRGGLLAFVRYNWYPVVCDPWTRQHRELPVFPWAAAAQAGGNGYFCLGAFLVDAGGNSRSSPMSSFRLLCVCVAKDADHNFWVESCVFSARDHRWVSPSTYDGVEISNLWCVGMYERFVGRAGGSIFLASGTHLLALDESTGEFSAFELPLAPGEHTSYHGQNLRVVAAGEGTGAVRIVRVVDGDALEVLTASRAHGAWECMVEKTAGLGHLTNIEVKPDRAWNFVDMATATTAGVLVLGVFSPPSSATTLLFSLDVETMKMKLQPETSRTMHQWVLPYERPWPQAI